jgi:condensin complex subunit 1
VATGRLEDKSSLVRKEALRLLGALMLHNPFGPALPLDRFAASLQVHREMLDQVMPPRSSKQSGEEFAATQEVLLEADQDGSGAEQQATGSEADGECRPKEEDKKMQEAAPMDMEGVDTTVENQDGQQEQQRNVQPQQAAPGGRTCAEVCWDGSVEELQALVASLELAVDFAK